MSWETIVVGFDDTDAARRALARGIVLARNSNARLVVASVSRVLPSGAAAHGLGPSDPADPPDAHQKSLDHARVVVSAEGLDEAEYVLREGPAADALVGIAEERNADLIVVGTRAPGFVDRLLHGSVSQSVARHANCDLLIVH